MPSPTPPIDYRYFILYKPYDVLSQFTKEIPEHKTLGDCFDFPSDVYPVGRLDRDSEGLLILTNDKNLNHRLLDPKFKHPRRYWAQVEGIPEEHKLDKLRQGVSIKINKKDYKTLPAKISLLTETPPIPERTPPIRERKNIPTSWVELILTEGKNRQVRKMCASIGFPVLRLIRHRICRLTMRDMSPGKVSEVRGPSLYKALDL